MRYRLSHIGDQIAQQVELFWRQAHGLAPAPDPSRIKINIQTSSCESMRTTSGRCRISAQGCAYSRQKLLLADSLCHVIHCTGIERAHGVFLTAENGQDNDGNL